MPCPQVVENEEFGYFCNKNMAVFFPIKFKQSKKSRFDSFLPGNQNKRSKKKTAVHVHFVGGCSEFCFISTFYSTLFFLNVFIFFQLYMYLYFDI